jgi:hypothetical protein
MRTKAGPGEDGARPFWFDKNDVRNESRRNRMIATGPSHVAVFP